MSLIKKAIGSDEVSVIGPKAYFQGTLNIKGSVRIDGKLKGNVINCKSVIIGKEGKVIGDISSETVSISGEVKGNIKGNQFVELIAKSVVAGNINTPKILVEEGAYFDGKCTMIGDENEKSKKAANANLDKEMQEAKGSEV